MCKNWKEKGNCRYGVKCLFAHGFNELTKTLNRGCNEKNTFSLLSNEQNTKFQTPDKPSNSKVKIDHQTESTNEDTTCFK